MTPAHLTDLYHWFTGYCATFRTDVVADQRNYDLKETHTYRVWSNSRLIADRAGFSDQERARWTWCRQHDRPVTSSS